MKKLKVFHGLVNFGSQAGLFARALREKGIDAVSVVYSDQYKRSSDIILDSGNGSFQNFVRRLLTRLRKLYWFFRYNTFHFYFGTTLFARQRDLPFYRFFGKKVLMEYLGYDVQLYQYSIEKYEVTNIRYYFPDDVALQDDKHKNARLNSESRYLDRQLVCAPYISEFVTGSSILPVAIDLKEYPFSPKAISQSEIVVMHAPTSRNNKGTSFILEALNQLQKEGYNIRVLLVENISHKALKLKYLECDIFVDQILSGWYGAAALEAMAFGRPTVCFIRESYFKYVEYGPDIPIVSATPSNIYDVLKRLIEEKDALPEIGRQSREFVEKIHDLEKVTDKLISIYTNIWS